MSLPDEDADLFDAVAFAAPDSRAVQADVQRALAEDVGSGDLSAALIDPALRAHATVLAREAAIVCGRPWVDATVRSLDPDAMLDWHVDEGQRCEIGDAVLTLHAGARALLSAERTALNFLQLLSAVATQAAHHVAAVAGTHARIVDTRKTLPGLRTAQKYAVTVGGGSNHRAGLYDAVLLKENHIAAAGGIAEVLQRARREARGAAFVQVEVETLAQLDEALDAGATMILLDNMDLSTLREAVQRNAGRAVLEASGGVTLDSARDIALTGVHRISVGGLTKDVRAIDFSMRFSVAP